MMTTKNVTFFWQHDGHKLSFEASRKDALYFLTVKGEDGNERCESLKPARLRSLREMIDRALEEVTAEQSGECGRTEAGRTET